MWTMLRWTWVSGKSPSDGLREAGQPVHGSDQEVLDPPVVEFGQDPEPGLGALGFSNPEREQLLLPREFRARARQTARVWM